MINELASPVESSLNKAPNVHVLSAEQHAILEEVKREFLSSEIVGLGKTTVLQHHIDVGSSPPVKQRYYFVSPAIQAILNKEVDDML